MENFIKCIRLAITDFCRSCANSHQYTLFEDFTNALGPAGKVIAFSVGLIEFAIGGIFALALVTLVGGLTFQLGAFVLSKTGWVIPAVLVTGGLVWLALWLRQWSSPQAKQDRLQAEQDRLETQALVRAAAARRELAQ